jgi:nitrogen regulatory protein PII
MIACVAGVIFFQRESIKQLTEMLKLKIIVVDVDVEEVVEWIGK